jgi:hypothetical protein
MLSVSRPRERTWISNGTGVWHDNRKWQAYWGIPNSSGEIAVFGGVITGHRTVVLEQSETIGGMRFVTPHSYAISGSGTLTIADDDGDAEIDVYAGSHQVQVAVNLDGNALVDVKPGASLAFQNVLRLRGHHLEKTGPGELKINGQLETGGGDVILSGGVLSGNGAIDGGLTNAGGSVSPGQSPGRLSIHGDFRQERNGVLRMEIAGRDPELHDVLDIRGRFRADGALEINLVDGFLPQLGDQFRILNFSHVVGGFQELRLPWLRPGLAWDTSHLLAADGGHLSVVSAVNIPEPNSSLILLPATLAPIGRWQRRPRLQRRRGRSPVRRQGLCAPLI